MRIEVFVQNFGRLFAEISSLTSATRINPYRVNCSELPSEAGYTKMEVRDKSDPLLSFRHEPGIQKSAPQDHHGFASGLF